MKMNWTMFFFGYVIGVVTVLVWAWLTIMWDEEKEKRRRKKRMDGYGMTVTTTGYQLTLDGEDAESLIAFIKNHERQDIPDNVWNICMRMYDALEEMTWDCTKG